MSTKAVQYASDSLAASGIAIIQHELAMLVRPGHWLDGVEARGDLASNRARVALGALPGVRQYTARIAGIPGEVQVLARSGDQLAQRIEWLTGRACADLTLDGQTAGQAAAVAPIVPRKADPTSSDPDAGRVTVEGPRACAACSHFSSVGSCMVASESGQGRPSANAPRRCLAFRPQWGASDSRTGVQLWPELTVEISG